jgi:GNAT superfamily N-acetyltransferase
VALVNNQPVALIVAKIRPLAEPLQMEREVYIDVIEVQPDHQRQGIGTELMKRVTTWARENQAYQIRAWSEEVRYEALMLWRKLGFAFSQVGFQRGDEQRYGFYVTKSL